MLLFMVSYVEYQNTMLLLILTSVTSIYYAYATSSDCGFQRVSFQPWHDVADEVASCSRSDLNSIFSDISISCIYETGYELL